MLMIFYQRSQQHLQDTISTKLLTMLTETHTDYHVIGCNKHTNNEAGGQSKESLHTNVEIFICTYVERNEVNSLKHKNVLSNLQFKLHFFQNKSDCKCHRDVLMWTVFHKPEVSSRGILSPKAKTRTSNELRETCLSPTTPSGRSELSHQTEYEHMSIWDGLIKEASSPDLQPPQWSWLHRWAFLGVLILPLTTRRVLLLVLAFQSLFSPQAAAGLEPSSPVTSFLLSSPVADLWPPQWSWLHCHHPAGFHLHLWPLEGSCFFTPPASRSVPSSLPPL